MPRTIEMIFGSDSDQDKILPGIQRFSAENPEVSVRVHYASADNTPEKVARIADGLRWDETEPVVYISGAGMSNVLTGVLKQKSRLTDLNIGIPIEDSVTGGLSSILSTCEKPPRNPVLTTPLNGSYTALNIALRFLEGEYDQVVVPVRKDVGDNVIGVVGLISELGKRISPYCEKPIHTVDPRSMDPNSLVITPFRIYSEDPAELIMPIDERLKEGRGVQICVLNPHCNITGKRIEGYAALFNQPTEVTGYVTAGSYTNAVIAAAQIMRNHTALAEIQREKDDKARKLEQHLGLTYQGKE